MFDVALIRLIGSGLLVLAASGDAASADDLPAPDHLLRDLMEREPEAASRLIEAVASGFWRDLDRLGLSAADRADVIGRASAATEAFARSRRRVPIAAPATRNGRPSAARLEEAIAAAVMKFEAEAPDDEHHPAAPRQAALQQALLERLFHHLLAAPRRFSILAPTSGPPAGVLIPESAPPPPQQPDRDGELKAHADLLLGDLPQPLRGRIAMLFGEAAKEPTSLTAMTLHFTRVAKAYDVLRVEAASYGNGAAFGEPDLAALISDLDAGRLNAAEEALREIEGVSVRHMLDSLSETHRLAAAAASIRTMRGAIQELACSYGVAARHYGLAQRHLARPQSAQRLQFMLRECRALRLAVRINGETALLDQACTTAQRLIADADREGLLDIAASARTYGAELWLIRGHVRGGRPHDFAEAAAMAHWAAEHHRAVAAAPAFHDCRLLEAAALRLLGPFVHDGAPLVEAAHVYEAVEADLAAGPESGDEALAAARLGSVLVLAALALQSGDVTALALSEGSLDSISVETVPTQAWTTPAEIAVTAARIVAARARSANDHDGVDAAAHRLERTIATHRRGLCRLDVARASLDLAKLTALRAMRTQDDALAQTALDLEQAASAELAELRKANSGNRTGTDRPVPRR